MSGDVQYVRSADIKAAVQGHETDVLDALGIEWAKGRGHIDCPYPDHRASGKNDWRWDTGRAKAFCTCASRGDTIENVVMKCEGLADYEAAKVRTAELIDRSDLIRTKGEAGGKVRMRQDVESLLHPPAALRDDAIPRAYLAHRLKIDPDTVVMPSTPVVGVKSLGYFDPPAGGAGKPVHVGDFPCAVFGQASPDGRRHAHRIYVAPGGQGKAVLGRDATGRERDPKKSARVPEGGTMTGCAVMWGEASTAGRVILCEGIETGAALAFAFAGELAAGALMIAAGISATGVEGFVPLDHITRVTVAADRDEKAMPGKPSPSRRGERAAREFAMRHREAIAIDIAMPGRRDDKADWLDVLLAGGVDAVRDGVEAAVRFEATADEIVARAERMGGEAELTRIAAECPLPALFGTQLEYRRFDGQVWAHKAVAVGKGEDRETIFVPVFTPFGIAARLRFVGDEKTYGLRLAVLDMAGGLRRLDVDRMDFARVGAAEARAMLFGAGLRVLDDGEKIAVECLKAAGPEKEITVVRKPGWHEIEGAGAPAFVCPDGTVLGLPEGRSLELASGAQLSGSVALGGTLQGWKEAVATATAVSGCQHWTLGVMAAFAGPIIDLTGVDSCGINFSGLSSSGKTTAQRLAASAWSKPTTKGETLFQTAKATVNSLELMAARSNGAVLVLDELAHVTGSETGKIIYTLASGTGKRRMTSTGAARQSHTWSTFAVLSEAVREKVEWPGSM